MLTPIQLTQFQVFGCLVLRGVLTADEIRTAGAEFAFGLSLTHESDRSGIGGQQLNWTNQRPETPFLGSLLEDNRFYGAARQILDQPLPHGFARRPRRVPFTCGHDHEGPSHADMLRSFLFGQPQHFAQSRLGLRDGPDSVGFGVLTSHGFPGFH